MRARSTGPLRAPMRSHMTTPAHTTTSLDELLDQAAAAHPEPSESADQIRAEAQQELAGELPAGATGAPPPGWVPPLGWDPAQHAYPPAKTTRGTWKRLRKGETPAAEIAGIAAAPDPGRCAWEHLEMICWATDALDARFPLPAGGDVAVTWRPADEERERLESALARYYRAHPEYMLDLPPGVALAVAVGMYALPRVLALRGARAAADAGDAQQRRAA